MSPFELRVLLHFATSPAPFERENVPIFPDTIRALTEMGLLEPADAADEARYEGKHKATARALFWIKHLLSTPLPEPSFIIPERT